MSPLASHPTAAFPIPAPGAMDMISKDPAGGDADSQAASDPVGPIRHSPDPRVRLYASSFADLMEMRAPVAVVETYLDRHEGWFRRCAAPMAVQPLGDDGYVLTLGR